MSGQAQIDRFVFIYNEERPHSARGCPPMEAWRNLDKAVVEIVAQPLLAHTKFRRDVVDMTGTITLRYRSKLHHVSVGRTHKGERVLILMADLDIRVIDDHGVRDPPSRARSLGRLPGPVEGFRLSQDC
jgi:hypothetical protein